MKADMNTPTPEFDIPKPSEGEMAVAEKAGRLGFCLIGIGERYTLWSTQYDKAIFDGTLFELSGSVSSRATEARVAGHSGCG
jgi:TolB-like protein